MFDGTLLDYALKIDGKPRLFLEAKAIGASLDDKAFIAQTVNYANNAGVLWCVLTNGIAYRVYKTNEPVSWGERVFVDKRVRKALASLAQEPPAALTQVVADSLGKPAIAPERLRESLAGILDVAGGGALGAAPTGSEPSSRAASASHEARSSPGKEYTLNHHLDGKPAAVVDLFEQVDEFARSLGADVSRRVRKQYVGYFRGKRSFCTVETQRQRAIVYLNLNPTKTKPWNEHSMRDVRKIGHFGMGDTEFSLRESAQLRELKDLVKQAYGETR